MKFGPPSDDDTHARKARKLVKFRLGGTTVVRELQQYGNCILDTSTNIGCDERECEWATCSTTGQLFQQNGVWLCSTHVLKPNCALSERCLCHRHGPFHRQGSNAVAKWRNGKATRASCISAAKRLQWTKMQQVDAEIRDTIYALHGKHALPGRAQFICSRCYHATRKARSRMEKSHIPEQPDEFLEYARRQKGSRTTKIPWLQYVRMHSREKAAIKDKENAEVTAQRHYCCNVHLSCTVPVWGI